MSFLLPTASVAWNVLDISSPTLRQNLCLIRMSVCHYRPGPNLVLSMRVRGVLFFSSETP